jgi:hypothetical protein
MSVSPTRNHPPSTPPALGGPADDSKPSSLVSTVGDALAQPLRRAIGDALLLALASASVAMRLAGASGAARLVLVFVAACLLPGAALLTRLSVQSTLERCALAVGLSLCVEAAGSLAMIWTGWWHPDAWALALVVASCALIAVDLAATLRAAVARGEVAPARPSLDVRRVAPWLPAVGAIAIWKLSLLHLDVSHLGDYGLPSALPLAWYLALAIAVLGAVWAIFLRGTSQLLVLFYLAVTALILFATIPAVSGQPHYAWVYKHIGVVRLFEAHGSANASIDIYNRWPGFFALAAVFSTVAGQANPVTYAGWADFVFVILDLLLLMAAVKAVARDFRVAAGAGLLFTLTDWVGQTYYSPQAFASVLAFAVLAIALRQLTVHGSGHRRLSALLQRVGRVPQLPMPAVAPQRWPRWAALTAILALDAVVVASHQLTPYMLLVSVALLLALGLIRPWWLLLAMAAMTLAYLAINFHFVQRNYGLFTSLDPFNNVQGAQITQHPSVGKAFNTDVELLFIALVWLTTLWAIVRLLRRGLLLRAASFVVLAVAPVAIAFGQNYGGEASLRIILFSGPWCSALIAWALLTIARPRVRLVALAATACIFAGLFVVSYLGQEELNIASAGEVSASEWFYDHAEHGSVLVLAAPGFPYRLGASYPEFRGPEGDANPNLLTEPIFRGRALGDSQVPAIAERIQQYSPHGYIAFTRDETTFAEVFRIIAPGALGRLEAAVARSPLFHLAYANGDAQIYELDAPAPTASPTPRPPARRPPARRLRARARERR